LLVNNCKINAYNISRTVTFLFTDIEGSTKLYMSTGKTTLSTWEASFNYKLKEAVETNNGHVFELSEDAFFWAFELAEKALNTAAGALINFANENREGAEVKVRIGIHSGYAEWNIQMNKICTVEFENNW